MPCGNAKGARVSNKTPHQPANHANAENDIENQNATEMKTRMFHGGYAYRLEPIRTSPGSLFTTFFFALLFLFEASVGGECVPRLLT
jgi:hypothetical protein